MAETENAQKMCLETWNLKAFITWNLYGNDTKDMTINHKPFHIKIAS